MARGVLFISSGLLAPKKADHVLARKHRYLNYGLLTLATLLHEQGYPVRLFHGGFACPEALADYVLAEYPDCGGYPVFLSLPSCFAIGWAQRFSRRVRSLCPNARIIVGGRWVVGEDGAWIRARLPEANLVVYGTAEERVSDLLNVQRWPSVPHTDRSLLPGAPIGWHGHVDLEYELVDNFSEFTPSIEVSRGCGMGCSFCEEREAKLTTLRPADNVARAMHNAVRLYGDPVLRFYLEASWFTPTASWAREFAQQYARNDLKTLWRCETRVDSLQAAILPDLAQAGLRVVDLGLESASGRQLIGMNKTRDVVRYLQRASDLLYRCYDLGIWAKVNVMLYAGETEETISQSREWLDRHRKCIKGVSVGAVTVYGHDLEAHRYLTELSALGASPVDSSSIDRDGYAHLHLSREIDHDRVEVVATEIARDLMSDRDYYDLKVFSYLPRGYTYEDFRVDLAGAGNDRVPFRIT
jgi:hypothetical protein